MCEVIGGLHWLMCEDVALQTLLLPPSLDAGLVPWWRVDRWQLRTTEVRVVSRKTFHFICFHSTSGLNSRCHGVSSGCGWLRGLVHDFIMGCAHASTH